MQLVRVHALTVAASCCDPSDASAHDCMMLTAINSGML